MARKKTIEAIENEISKVKSDMSKLQDRYDKLAEKLEDLQSATTAVSRAMCLQKSQQGCLQQMVLVSISGLS